MEKVNTVAQCASELPVNEFSKWLDALEKKLREDISRWTAADPKHINRSLSIKTLNSKIDDIIATRALITGFIWEKNDS